MCVTDVCSLPGLVFGIITLKTCPGVDPHPTPRICNFTVQMKWIILTHLRTGTYLLPVRTDTHIIGPPGLYLGFSHAVCFVVTQSHTLTKNLETQIGIEGQQLGNVCFLVYLVLCPCETVSVPQLTPSPFHFWCLLYCNEGDAYKVFCNYCLFCNSWWAGINEPVNVWSQVFLSNDWLLIIWINAEQVEQFLV